MPNHKVFSSLALPWLFRFLWGGGKWSVFPGKVSTSPVIWSPWSQWTTLAGECGVMGFQICEIPVLFFHNPMAPAVQLWYVEVEWAGGSGLPPFLLYSPSNVDKLTCMTFLLHLHPTLGLIAEFTCCSGNKWSIIPVLWLTGNVLFHPKGRMRGGEFWEVKGRQPRCVAFFLHLEC